MRVVLSSINSVTKLDVCLPDLRGSLQVSEAFIGWLQRVKLSAVKRCFCLLFIALPKNDNGISIILIKNTYCARRMQVSFCLRLKKSACMC